MSRNLHANQDVSNPYPFLTCRWLDVVEVMQSFGKENRRWSLSLSHGPTPTSFR
jgi:hypothetical protein